VLGTLGSGCYVEDHHHSHRGELEPLPAAAPEGDDTASAREPMLVVIDTDQTMTADPGQGVGVFLEYAAGGAWTVFWTCDTAVTQKTCDVSLGMSVAEGAIEAVDTSFVPGGFTAQSTPASLDVATTTGSELHGITFRTAPGAVLTLDARVGGLSDGSFLFFVQDGKVNGGFAGVLTNPLKIQGSKP
jgi:hypothetical protein